MVKRVKKPEQKTELDLKKEAYEIQNKESMKEKIERLKREQPELAKE